MKLCSACNIKQDINNFTDNLKSEDGKCNKCTKCKAQHYVNKLYTRWMLK